MSEHVQTPPEDDAQTELLSAPEPHASEGKARKTPGRVGKPLKNGALSVAEALNEHLLLSALGFLAIILIVLFFVGLAVLQPTSQGDKTTLSNIQALINDGRVHSAVLQDQDKRIEVN